MNTVEIKINVDVDNAEQVNALNVLVKTIRETRAEAQPEETKPAAPSRSRSKKVEAPAESLETSKAAANMTVVQEETVEAETEDNLMGDAPAAAKAVTLEDVRAAAEPKINAHRDAIKAKLQEYGAQNIGTVDPAHYGMFKAFLTSLK